MSNQQLKTLFLISASRMNKKGLVPVICRITYLGNRKPFSTGLFVNPKHWNSKLQKAHPPNEANSFINTQISLIKQEINQAFLFLQVKTSKFELHDIFSYYKGEPIQKERGLLETYTSYLERIEKLIDKDIKRVTYNKYIESKGHLADFIKFHFRYRDIKLAEVKYQFITDYEYYLKTEKNLHQSTINKAIQRFRRVIKFAIASNIMDKDPFILYNPIKPKKHLVFLSPEELQSLEEHSFSQRRLAQVRDMFVFCCYTGLAFNEMHQLKIEHIKNGADGLKWIKITRAKTGKEVSVPLLPTALHLLDQFLFDNNDDRIFSAISNQKFNSYLKEIADIIGIGHVNLTHHIARKTFASTILLFNDVPMEIVSELLGHSKISITQDHYGKVVQKKISEHMLILSKNLNAKQQN